MNITLPPGSGTGIDWNGLRDTIKAAIPADAYLERSPKAGHGMYICPFCGSGTGEHGTGALQVNKDGTAYCHVCGKAYDVIDVYQKTQGIQDYHEALQALRTGKVKVLFSVDMFNEGLDVPDVDMVLFLRPTESPIVFLQQLGRGLRKAPGKEYLIVLDFIGNYEKAGAIPLYLTGDGRDHGNRSGNSKKPGAYPDDCIVDFDMKLIDLFRKLGERVKTVQKRIDEEVDRIRDELGHVPSRMELFTGMDESIYRLCLSTTKNNLFRDYLGYLKRREDMVSPIAPPQEHWLTKEEQGLCSGIAKEFLDLISTTMMSKIYKMPILYTFYNDGQPAMEITDEMALKEWKHFFDTGTNWKDLPDVTTFEQYQALSNAWHLKKMHEMPIHFLQQPVNKGFFVQKPGCALALKDGLEEVIREPAFIRQFKDILDYRTMDYYRRRYEKQNNWVDNA